MLDSLVRGSRRVGGATDLLDREMRTATEHCSLYESSHVPVWRGARNKGLQAEPTTSPEPFGPSQTVPVVNHGGNAPERKAGQAAKSLLIKYDKATNHQG